MLLGVYPVIGIVLLMIFLLGVSFQIHTFWKVDDAQMKQIDMINFTKNMARSTIGVLVAAETVAAGSRHRLTRALLRLPRCNASVNAVLSDVKQTLGEVAAVHRLEFWRQFSYAAFSTGNPASIQPCLSSG